MKKREAKWYIDKALKPPKAFFDWCYSNIPTYKWSNKKETILASERMNCEVIEKRLTKNSNLSFNAGFYVFTIVLVTKKRIEIQTYCVWHEIKKGKEYIEMELSNFELLQNKKHIQIGKFWNGYGYGLVSIGVQGGKYTGAKLYDNSWQKKIKEISELKYIDFNALNESLTWFSWLPHFYKWRLEIEYLQKLKAFTIAEQIAKNRQIDYRTLTPGWFKKNKHLLKNCQDSFYQFELKRRIEERGGKVIPGIEKFMKFSDINHIPKKARMVNFQNWIIKNKVDFEYYKDYLMLLDEMGVVANTDNLITPKDLIKAHDNAVELFNIMTAEGKTKSSQKERKLYEKRIKQMNKLETMFDDFVFIIPKSTKEIINEGKQLSHCVGGSHYVDGHFKGTTTIVFVRSKNNPNKPFFTLEYKSGEINQIRGKYNKSAPKEVKAAADKWLAWVKKGCKHGKNEVKNQKEKAPAA